MIDSQTSSQSVLSFFVLPMEGAEALGLATVDKLMRTVGLSQSGQPVRERDGQRLRLVCEAP